MSRYVIEVPYRNPATDAEGTLLFGTIGFTTTPSDTPANTEVEPRLREPALLRRDLFARGETGGGSSDGYGPIRLANEDGGLDYLRTYSLNGRVAVARYAEDDDAVYPSGYTTVLTARMRQPDVGLNDVTIELRDRRLFATAAFQPNKYGGTNTLPDGVDGIESDLKGKPIPVLFGRVLNIAPPCVNTSKLIYQVHDGDGWGAIRDILAVYDSGALLEPDLDEDGARQDYTDQADMEANEPAEGTYRVWLAGGMFRLGSSPAGVLTCDAIRGNAPNERDAAALLAEIVDAGGDAEITVNADDLAALRTANRATLGLWVHEETTNQAVLDQVLTSVGAWGAIDSDGVLRCAVLTAPSGDPVLTVDRNNLAPGSLRAVAINDEDVPYERVTVRGVRNYTKQVDGLVGSVGAARRARLAQEYQDAVEVSAAVAADYDQPPDLTVTTLLQCLTACEAEAARLLALYATKRDRFELSVRGSIEDLAGVGLGSVIELELPRLGLDAGKLQRVIGMRYDPVEQVLDLTTWG